MALSGCGWEVFTRIPSLCRSNINELPVWTWIWSTRRCRLSNSNMLSFSSIEMSDVLSLISMLEKLNMFRLTSLRTLLLSMRKWLSLFLRKNHLFRCWGCLSLLNWIEMSIAMSMAHRPNIVSLSFIRITLVDFHLNWLH